MSSNSCSETARFAFKKGLTLKCWAKLLHLDFRHSEVISLKGEFWSTESNHFRREFGKFSDSGLVMFFLWQSQLILRA